MYASGVKANYGGEISFSIEENKTQKEILDYLRQWLPLFPEWAGNFHRQKATKKEDSISESLERFMQFKLKTTNLLINFNRQKGVDFRFWFDSSNIKSPPIFLIEAKRLPPTSTHDYVHHSQKPGGISRFKLKQHGFDYNINVGAMLGYVQQGDFPSWHKKINSWIDNFIKTNDDTLTWTSNDKLVKIKANEEFAEYVSNHLKVQNDVIRLYHFWIKV